MNIKRSVRAIIKQIEGTVRPELEDTPARVERAYEEMFDGYKVEIPALFNTFEQDGSDQIVALKDIVSWSVCISGESLIYTVNGYLPIKDLVGKEIYVYCVNPQNQVEVRKASNIRLTRKNVSTLKITTDKNNMLTLTPEHRVMLLDGTYKSAENLQPGDRLFHVRKAIFGGRPSILYSGLKTNAIPEHRLVYESLFGTIPDGFSVHHIDKNRLNNNPDNLVLLKTSNHLSLHATERWNYLPEDKKMEVIMRTNKSSNKSLDAILSRKIGLIEYYQTEEGIRNRIERSYRTKKQWERQRLVKQNTINHSIAKIENAGLCDVYNMDVEGFNNYIANEFVVHNCEHHMLPFRCCVHVAYLPTTKVIGASKLERLVHAYCHRLQIQERIGKQIADTLMQYLEPRGVAVIIHAEHLCMRCRGVKSTSSQLVNSVMLGVFRESPISRMEVLSLLGQK